MLPSEFWEVIIVTGRPSLWVSDFFNSIKFDHMDVRAHSREDAMRRAEERFGVELDLSDGYVILNWYAFPSGEERNGSNQEA